MKDQKGITITNAFKKFLDEPDRKQNNIWVDKGYEIRHRSMKSRLEKNDIDMYSTRNEGKFAAFERFVRTLKNKICKIHDFSFKNVYIDKLDDIVNKYKNTYLSTIKMKPVNVKSSRHIDSSKEIN